MWELWILFERFFYNIDNFFKNDIIVVIYLEIFIEKNDIKIGNRNITYQELLKILFIINGNDIVIDFENLDKCLNNIKR